MYNIQFENLVINKQKYQEMWKQTQKNTVAVEDEIYQKDIIL